MANRACYGVECYSSVLVRNLTWSRLGTTSDEEAKRCIKRTFAFSVFLSKTNKHLNCIHTNDGNHRWAIYMKSIKPLYIRRRALQKWSASLDKPRINFNYFQLEIRAPASHILVWVALSSWWNLPFQCNLRRSPPSRSKSSLDRGPSVSSNRPLKCRCFFL